MTARAPGRAFQQYNYGSPSRWDWIQSGLGAIARDEGLFTTYRPIMNYTEEEAGFPFRFERSIWWMCTGLLSQVMFTMPMRRAHVGEGWMWTAASVLALRASKHLRFDPTLPTNFDDPQARPDTSGLSMMEKYVNLLLKVGPALPTPSPPPSPALGGLCWGWQVYPSHSDPLVTPGGGRPGRP